MRKLPVLLSIVILLLSCSGKKKLPKGIIEPKKMENVFWDYIRADVFARDFTRKDSLKRDTIENVRLQKKIFSYYNISKEDFYRSYDYYLKHPDLMNAVLDSMVAKQNRIRQQEIPGQLKIQ
jgi:hypothetical protein